MQASALLHEKPCPVSRHNIYHLLAVNPANTNSIEYVVDLLRTFFCPGWISFLSKQLALLARSFILEIATLGENLR